MYEQTSLPRSPGLWLGLSIAAAILCCWPLAIPGIVFAAQAMQAQGQGDVDRWQERVDKSRFWTLLSVFLTLGLVLVAVALAAAGVFEEQQTTR